MIRMFVGVLAALFVYKKLEKNEQKIREWGRDICKKYSSPQEETTQ